MNSGGTPGYGVEAYGGFDMDAGYAPSVKAHSAIEVGNYYGAGAATFSAELGSPFTNKQQVVPSLALKGWAFVTWNNGAPVLAGGSNVSSITNPSTGQIGVVGSVTGLATVGYLAFCGGAFVPTNATGGSTLFNIKAATAPAGANIDFAATTGSLTVALLGI